jgi:hypothetical protein
MAKRTNRAAPGAGSRAPHPRDQALYNLTKDELEKLRAHAASIDSGLRDQTKVLGDIATTLSELGGADNGPVPMFGGGGAYAIGPNGRRIGGGYGRPGFGAGGYPGGAGYGMGGYPGGGGPAGFGGFGRAPNGGMGGLLGMAQGAAAQMIHNRSGLGNNIWRQTPEGMWQAVDQQGAPVPGMAPITDQAYAQRASVSERAYQIGSSHNIFGAVKGALGELPTGLKVAGGIATGGLLAAEGLYKFGQFVGNQRAANAQYQAIYGPGTSGFDQRLHEFGGRFRNFTSNLQSALPSWLGGGGPGGLSDADYQKAFKGVSSMGFQGSDRNRMIGFATNNFNSMGMGVDQSLQVISINAKEASTNLATLSGQLKSVSQMAQQAGQSAETFRQAYIQSYGNAVGAGFAGSSGALATAQVASTVGQGRLFAGLDTSAMYSSLGGQQVLANREGYGSVLDFALATQANPMVAADAQQRQLNQVFMSVVPADVRAMIEASIRRNGGAQNIATNQNSAMRVVNDVEHQRPGSLNAVAIISAMRAAGIAGAESLDAVAASIYYVQWVAKQGQNFTNPVAKAVAANQQQTLGPKNDKAASKKYLDLAMGGQHFGLTDRNGSLTFDPVIGQMEKSGIKSVEVQTAQGPIVVDMATAAKTYRDQLTSGTAVIMSGDKTGQTVGTAFGTESNARFGDSTKRQSQGGVFDKKTWEQIKGLDLTDQQVSTLTSLNGIFRKDIPEIAKKMAADNAGGKGSNGTITVGLKPDVAKYLEITTTGDSLVNQAASMGAPPALSATGSSTGH